MWGNNKSFKIWLGLFWSKLWSVMPINVYLYNLLTFIYVRWMRPKFHTFSLFHKEIRTVICFNPKWINGCPLLVHLSFEINLAVNKYVRYMSRRNIYFLCAFWQCYYPAFWNDIYDTWHKLFGSKHIFYNETNKNKQKHVVSLFCCFFKILFYNFYLCLIIFWFITFIF